MKTRTFPHSSIILGLLLLLAPWTDLAEAHAAAVAARPISQAEAAQLGENIQSYITAKTPRRFLDLVDMTAVVERAMAGSGAPQKTIQEIAAGAGRGFQSSLERVFAGGASYHFDRVKLVNQETRLVFRMVQTNGAMNFHELVLNRGDKDQIRIVDIFVYMTGDMISETFQRMMIPMLADKQRSTLEKLFVGKSDLVKSMPQCLQIIELVRKGSYAEVIAEYKKLPFAVQKEKFMLIPRIKAAMETDDNDYLAAMDLWKRTYPEDPSLNLILIDAHFLKKEYREAIQCIDRLEKSVGPDAYLDYQRALLSKFGGDESKSLEMANRAIEKEPDLLVAYDIILASHSQQKRFKEAVELLNKAEAASHKPRSVLASGVEQSESLSALAASKEFKAWRGTATNRTAQTNPPASGANASAAPVTTLKLQGLYYKTNGANATINGKYVLVGDTVAGHKVLSITKDSVTLEKPDGSQTTLQMK